MGSKATGKYLHMNHHHELTEDHQIVDFGHGEFVANKMAIPILKALNEAGLRTRTHHMGENGNFVSILLDQNVRVELRPVNEIDATRTEYNGMAEVLISWSRP